MMPIHGWWYRLFPVIGVFQSVGLEKELDGYVRLPHAAQFVPYHVLRVGYLGGELRIDPRFFESLRELSLVFIAMGQKMVRREIVRRYRQCFLVVGSRGRNTPLPVAKWRRLFGLAA